LKSKGGKVQEQIVGYVPKETIQKALEDQQSGYAAHAIAPDRFRTACREVAAAAE
jgi:hypothetical protein